MSFSPGERAGVCIAPLIRGWQTGATAVAAIPVTGAVRSPTNLRHRSEFGLRPIICRDRAIAKPALA